MASESDQHTSQASPATAAPSSGGYPDGIIDQYQAITEADRRWGQPQQRGIALEQAGTFAVGINDDRRRERHFYGKGPSYEAAFRDAEAQGYVANGQFSDRPPANPFVRGI